MMHHTLRIIVTFTCIVPYFTKNVRNWSILVTSQFCTVTAVLNSYLRFNYVPEESIYCISVFDKLHILVSPTSDSKLLIDENILTQIRKTAWNEDIVYATSKNIKWEEVDKSRTPNMQSNHYSSLISSPSNRLKTELVP